MFPILRVFFPLIVLSLPPAARAGEMVSGTQFAADPLSFDGKRVVVNWCEIFRREDAQGLMACRAKADGGVDAKDPSGLPVYIFFKVADLSAEARAFVDACPDVFCPSSITGDASVSPGTLYVAFANVAFAPKP